MTTKDELDLDELEALARGGKKKEPASDGELSPIYAFEIDVKDARGKRWHGKFVFKVPTLGDQVTIARVKAGLLPNGAQTDPNGALIAEMMAYTQVCFTTKPAWWKPARFYDGLPLIAAYKEARQYEARFLNAAVADGGDDTSEDGEERDASDQGDVG